MQLTSVFLTLVAAAAVIAAPAPLVELAKRGEFVKRTPGNHNNIRFTPDYRPDELAEGTQNNHDNFTPDYRHDELAERTE